MTREIFETLLNTKDILWNDMVVLTVINPHYKKSFFNKTNKFIYIEGALGYHLNDEHITLCTYVEGKPLETQFLHFAFNEIVDINKVK